MKQTDQTAWEGDLETGYCEMAQDVDREIEALSLAEATIGDLCEEVGEVERDFLGLTEWRRFTI